VPCTTAMRLGNRPLSRTAVLAAAATGLAFVSIATASFQSSSSAGPMAISSATLAPATGPSATCNNGVAKIRWTATSSAWADGYDVLRGTTNGGSYPTIFHRVGRTTVSYNDASIDGNSVYYYVVRATKNNWRSSNTSQLTVDSSNC
jgi:hypothetical protein